MCERRDLTIGSVLARAPASPVLSYWPNLSVAVVAPVVVYAAVMVMPVVLPANPLPVKRASTIVTVPIRAEAELEGRDIPRRTVHKPATAMLGLNVTTDAPRAMAARGECLLEYQSFVQHVFPLNDDASEILRPDIERQR